MRIVLNAFLGARRVGLVSGSLRFAVGRLLVLTILGLVWLAIEPCPARAQGCHVPERPTLGYTTTASSDQFDLDALWLPRFHQAEAQVSPHPCSGDFARGSVPQPVAPAVMGELCPPGAAPGVSGWITSAAPRTRPLDDPSRIDRPPRSRPSAL
jgi:hypothetical protein